MKPISIILCALALAFACTATAFAAACCAGGSACCPVVAAVAVPDNTLTPAEKAAGWQLLFDGKTLNGWQSTSGKTDGWPAENGALACTGKTGAYLYTPQMFGNFELKCDFRVDHGTNSGIFFRWTNPADPVQTGIEMQVYDTSGKANPDKHDCGAVYDIMAPSENMMKPAMEWNSVDIKCLNNWISITMNGKRIIALDLNRWTEPHKNPDGTENKFDQAYKDMVKPGHIGFQDHGGRVWYKNIKIREL